MLRAWSTHWKQSWAGRVLVRPMGPKRVSVRRALVWPLRTGHNIRRCWKVNCCRTARGQVASTTRDLNDILSRNDRLVQRLRRTLASLVVTRCLTSMSSARWPHTSNPDRHVTASNHCLGRTKKGNGPQKFQKQYQNHQNTMCHNFKLR